MHIVIIHRASDRVSSLPFYTVNTLAQLWQEKGHRVTHLFGSGSYVPADVALLHVNLSLVPQDYLTLARRYPLTLNGEISDIRKSRISQNLVRAKDAYTGPVIVKSNFNYGGLPENDGPEKKRRFLFLRRKPRTSPLPQPLIYPIYPSLAEVPPAYRNDPLLVTEKFLPEIADGFYYVRHAFFLGEHHRSWRARSAHPVIREENELDDTEIPTPDEIKRFRADLKLDYGKIDFLEHEGKLVILDVNKTIGAPAPPLSIAYLAAGLESLACPVT